MSKRKLQWVILTILVIITISQTNMIQTNSIEGKEANKDVVELTYESDLIAIDLNMNPEGGATEGLYGISTIKDQYVGAHFYLDSSVDPDRKAIINFVFRNSNQGARTTDGALYLLKVATDGSYDIDIIESWTSFDPVFTASWGSYAKSYELTPANLEANHSYTIGWRNDETDNGNSLECWVCCVQVKYYIKRTLPTS